MKFPRVKCSISMDILWHKNIFHIAFWNKTNRDSIADVEQHRNLWYIWLLFGVSRGWKNMEMVSIMQEKNKNFLLPGCCITFSDVFAYKFMCSCEAKTEEKTQMYPCKKITIFFWASGGTVVLDSWFKILKISRQLSPQYKKTYAKLGKLCKKGDWKKYNTWPNHVESLEFYFLKFTSYPHSLMIPRWKI